MRFSIPQQSLAFLENPPAYTSPDVLEPSKENPAKVSPASPNRDENKTEVTLMAQRELEPTARNDDFDVQIQAQENQPNEKHMEPEKRDVQRDHVGQKHARTEPQTFRRPQSTVAINPRLQHTASTHSVRPINATPPPPPPQHPTTANPQGAKGVGGWLKSFADGF